MRVEVRYLPTIGDGREQSVGRALHAAGIVTSSIELADVFIIDGVPGCSEDYATGMLCDPVAQRAVIGCDAGTVDTHDGAWNLLIEVSYRPGVSDPVATTLRDVLSAEFGRLRKTALVQTARQYRLLTDEDHVRVAQALHNPLIQTAVIITAEEFRAGVRPPESYPRVELTSTEPVARIDVAAMDDPDLEKLNRQRLLALSRDELRAVRDYYSHNDVVAARRRAGLDAEATDVELEMIAQTWSEHCKHKIFAARIQYVDTSGDAAPVTETIDGLFGTYIKATTEAVSSDDGFLKSVFHDNSGVIRFDDETLLCFKAETHNSPSALDPYGGAITGIVGVNRDILGTGKGARPIFNTNVLCFGAHDTPSSEIPPGLLHPRTVLDGVHRGIVDGGNQSGIPVVAGAFLFDESFLGKPLVFCGTGGILPAEVNDEGAWIHHIDAGDLAVMVGGRIGKDGIHGATFSSLALDETSPTSAVQIGDPITQKKMLDFLLEARDLGLYKGITDNGAGGLSSSLGEMARESGGIEIDLSKCPLKYEGLAPWEILVSESQERMSLAVDASTIDALLQLASRRGVEATVVGIFTDSGAVVVRYAGQLVARVDLDFLHDGVPQMDLKAEWSGPRAGAGAGFAQPVTDEVSAGRVHDDLLSLLADPNIASKEHLVRQYDHEVQGGSVVKPFCGPEADGPTDGGVLRPRYDSNRCATVTHGVCPRYSDVDTYLMAVAAVDEAVRAHVALGGDPDQMAALDNFCWPDPVESEATPDGRYKLAQLVRACRGLSDACRAYALPLISGKDSMKNDANLGGRKVSIRPTLLISLIGIIPDIDEAMTSHFRSPGDVVYLVGRYVPALGGTAYERHVGDALGAAPSADLGANFSLYRQIHEAIRAGEVSAVHDLSDGGLAVALAESALGGRLGAEITLPSDGNVLEELFGESTGTFVVTCRPDHAAPFEERMRPLACRRIGSVTEKPELTISIDENGDRFTWRLDELVAAWGSLNRALDGIDHRRSVDLAGYKRTRTDAELAHAEIGQPHGEPEPSVRATDSAPLTTVLTGYGINADLELIEAFSRAGARTRRVHVNDLLADPRLLDDARILAFPGGFSYGDHVGSGLVLAHRLRVLREALDRFRASQGLILGICNGFQVLVKMGILPDLAGSWEQEVSLVHNASGLFEDGWVTARFEPGNTSPWLANLTGVDLPIRHGEGRFVAPPQVVEQLEADDLVALRYENRNPNGSVNDIAGITDRTGMVLGMMPHPEAFLSPHNHPFGSSGRQPGAATRLFRNAILHASAV